LRRGGLGARRLRPGGDHRPDRGAAARDEARPPLRHAQPRADPDDRRRGGRHERRTDRRAWQGGRRARRPAGLLHEGAPRRHAEHGDGAGGGRRVRAVAEELERTLGGGAASFAAYVDGELAVDLWAGAADRDTLYPVFSGTKGFVSVCLLKLIERGQLELEAPVQRYWPEFSHPAVLVRHVASHTAGLIGLRRAFAAAELLDGR